MTDTEKLIKRLKLKADTWGVVLHGRPAYWDPELIKVLLDACVALADQAREIERLKDDLANFRPNDDDWGFDM